MTSRAARIGLLIAVVAYVLFVGLVGFWSTPVDRPLDAQLDGILFRLHELGAPGWVNYANVERGANVAFFVPVGLLLALLLPKRLWFVALLLGVLGSCTIELGQLLLLPARYASWGDIACNSLGTAIGVGLAVLIRRVVRPPRTTVAA